MAQLLRGMQQRSHSLDLVRFLALVLVVAGHVWTDYPLSGYVAIFFIVTGYLWKPGRTVREEVAHKWGTLLLPYVAWGVPLLAVYTLINFLQVGSISAVAKSSAAIVWGGVRATEPFTAYWFLTAMFFACLMYRAAINSKQSWVIAALIMLSVVGAMLIGSHLTALPLGIGNALWSVQFIAAGHLLQKMRNWITAPRIAGVALVVLGLAAIWMGVDRMVLKSGDFGTPLLSLSAVVAVSWGSLLLAEGYGPTLPQRLMEWCTALVMTSTPVLLLHAIPIWLWWEGLPSWVLFIVCVTAPVLLGFALLSTNGLARRYFMPGMATWAAVECRLSTEVPAAR